MRVTVFGSRGFIGSHLVRHFRSQGHDVWTPERNQMIEPGADCGHVIYAIGLTGDFRQRLQDTIDAHVTVMCRTLHAATFQSWLYLSSTRVYGGLPSNVSATETMPIQVAPGADTTYDLSKLLGEAICLAQARPTVRVARLSNVIGEGQSEHTFVGAALAEARRTGRVTLREAPQSSKDYIAIEDVVSLLEQIALSGRERIYNVASGISISHAELAQTIRAATGASVEFVEHAPVRIFPTVSTERIRSEFGFEPRSPLDRAHLLAS